MANKGLNMTTQLEIQRLKGLGFSKRKISYLLGIHRKKKIGERLDSRLKQDAKKIKSFFGIKTKKEREEEENNETKSE